MTPHQPDSNLSVTAVTYDARVPRSGRTHPSATHGTSTKVPPRRAEGRLRVAGTANVASVGRHFFATHGCVLSTVVAALVLAERRLPVLAAVVHAQDVDHESAGRLAELLGDQRPPLECGWSACPALRPRALARRSEDQVWRRCGRGPSTRRAERSRPTPTPAIQSPNSLSAVGLRGAIDSARHERAAHLVSKPARTFPAGIARDGSAFNASSYTAADSSPRGSTTGGEASPPDCSRNVVGPRDN